MGAESAQRSPVLGTPQEPALPPWYSAGDPARQKPSLLHFERNTAHHGCPAAIEHSPTRWAQQLDGVCAANVCISQRQVAWLPAMLKAGWLQLTGLAIRCPRGRPVPGCPVHGRVAGRDAVGKPLRRMAVGGAIWQRLHSRRAQRRELILGQQRTCLCAWNGYQPLQHAGEVQRTYVEWCQCYWPHQIRQLKVIGTPRPSATKI